MRKKYHNSLGELLKDTRKIVGIPFFISFSSISLAMIFYNKFPEPALLFFICALLSFICILFLGFNYAFTQDQLHKIVLCGYFVCFIAFMSFVSPSLFLNSTFFGNNNNSPLSDYLILLNFTSRMTPLGLLLALFYLPFNRKALRSIKMMQTFE